MKIIRIFMKIVYTKYIFFIYHKQTNKISRNILRVVIGPVWPEGVPACLGFGPKKKITVHEGQPGPTSSPGTFF
jgi:hypothetical protein